MRDVKYTKDSLHILLHYHDNQLLLWFQVSTDGIAFRDTVPFVSMYLIVSEFDGESAEQ